MEENHHDEIRLEMPLPIEDNTRRLYEASKIGSVEILKTLIQESPDIIHNGLISFGIFESPLHISIQHGHLEFTQFLLNLKPELVVEFDALQRTPLHLASANGDIKIVRALLEKNTSACLVRDLKGLIPLHYAAIEGRIEIMKELINARPQSICTKISNGQTVLHLCVKDNCLEAIKLLTEILLIHDEEFLNSSDISGNTALDLALMLRQIETVRYLLSVPRIKTGTSTMEMDLTASNTIKEGPRQPSYYNFGNIKKRNESDSELSSPSKKRGCWPILKECLKYKGDKLQEVQGTMMLVATVIATVTFQAAINPPCGLWQQNMWGNDQSSSGTAKMGHKYGYIFTLYLMANTISFLASVTVILLIISRIPLRNRICAAMLTLAMCAAVAFLTTAYVLGIRMITTGFPSPNAFPLTLTLKHLYYYGVCVWFGMAGAIGLSYVIRFLVWMMKSWLLPTFNNSKISIAPITSSTNGELSV